jgi:hypothetical protein
MRPGGFAGPTLGWLGLLWYGITSTAVAQVDVSARGRWAVGLSVGISSFSGVTEGSGLQGEAVSFTPYRPTMWGIAVARGGKGLRMGVTARYGEAGLAIRGVPPSETGPASGVVIIAEGAYHLTAFTAELSALLLRLRGGPALRPSLGIEVERWTAPGTPARSIAGGQAGLALEVILTRALVATLEGELGFTPASPFHAADLPEGYHVRSAWRRTLAAGLYWRF